MVQVKPLIHISLLWLSWMVIFQALVRCHGIPILGKSPIKWRQRPDMTLAVVWDVKNQFKRTNKNPLETVKQSKGDSMGHIAQFRVKNPHQ